MCVWVDGWDIKTTQEEANKINQLTFTRYTPTPRPHTNGSNHSKNLGLRNGDEIAALLSTQLLLLMWPHLNQLH